jgi:protein ATS1
MPLVYALGSNGAGQLGVGHLNDVAKAQKCVFMSTGSVPNGSGSHMNEGDEVKKIVAGGNHTLVLMESGRVFAAGRNVDGRLGLSSEHREEDVRAEFEEVDFSEHEEVDGYPGGDDWKVTDIEATWEASIFVFNHRVLFACGSGTKGELGLGPNVQLANTLKKVFEVEEAGLHIVDVAACMAHVVIIISDGSLFGWGGCRKGQLGQSVRDEKLLWTPRRLDGDISFNPERAVIGREYTVLVRSGEQPVVWGDTKFFKVDDLGVLGQNEVLVSGWSAIHSSPSTPTFSVRSIGRNDRGQLASNKLPPLRTLAAGSEHCVGITSTRGVVAWGWGEHGNCGEPLDDKGNGVDRWNQIPVPHLEDGIMIRDVAAGCATTFIICGRDG